MSLDIEQELKRTLAFWNTMTPEEQIICTKNTYFSTFKKGEELASLDAECVGGFIVLKGCVRIYVMSEEGRQVTIMRIHQGETCFMGASCVLHSIACDVFMQAEDDADCLIISPMALRQVFNSNLLVENFVLNALIERFSDAMWNIQQILFMSMDRRLAIFLYEEATRNQSNSVHLTQEQIAQAVGSAREVISRMLRYFSEENITRTHRGTIEIVDFNKLKHLALNG